MFKNKDVFVGSVFKIIMVYAVFMGIIMLIGYTFDTFAVNYIESKVGSSIDSFNEMYNKIYSNWFGVLIIIQNIVAILIPIFFWKILYKSKLSNMGLKNISRCKKQLFLGLFMGVIAMTSIFLIIILTNNGYVEEWRPNFTFDMIYYFFIFIFVGLGEEILTRGYFMSVLRQTKSITLIISISAVAFSLMHIFNSAFSLIPFINIVLVGMLFSYMYIKSGNIWMPIGYHIAWNYFQGNVFGFKVSGLDINGIITTKYINNNIINGGEFGPEGGLIATGIVIIVFIFLWLYYRNDEFDFLDMDN